MLKIGVELSPQSQTLPLPALTGSQASQKLNQSTIHLQPDEQRGSLRHIPGSAKGRLQAGSAVQPDLCTFFG
jgi:hypothetical protein